MSEIPKGARPSRQPQGYTFWTIGDDRAIGRDTYRAFLRAPWPLAIALIAAFIVALNVAFASIYLMFDGLNGARKSSFWDAFVFSVQTLHTIGYGQMAPQSTAANVIVIVESIVGIIVIAIITGLVFTKFAHATARIAFSQYAVICQHDGKRTLMFRLSNRRSNSIVAAELRVIASMTTTTAEGSPFYRLHDLKLVRDRQSGMRRGWLALHVIDETSPLYGMDSAALASAETELEVALIGTDDITGQSVHAFHYYTDAQIKLDHRFADMMKPLDGGDLLIDMRQFDVIVPDATPRGSVATP
jgi:inward rectifier potassium channel